jgi:heat shock protein HslJ
MTLFRTLALLAALGGCSGSTQMAAPAPPRDLGGTSWQLVRFQGGDDTVLTPDDRSKYTLAFAADGSVSARLDCNRGRATWKSSAPGQLELGPLALTRAACPPGSLHDRMVKHWSFVRSYLVRNGRLYLSLMADGGIYEFEPIATKAAQLSAEPLENTYWKLTHLGPLRQAWPPRSKSRTSSCIPTPAVSPGGNPLARFEAR